MKTSLKALTIAGACMVVALTIGASPARAQTFLGYSGPGLSFSVGTGGDGYYGGGYYGGYPAVAPGYVIAPPVAAVVVRPPVYVPGPVIGPRPFVVRRPYGWYRPYPYRYWW